MLRMSLPPHWPLRRLARAFAATAATSGLFLPPRKPSSPDKTVSAFTSSGLIQKDFEQFYGVP
jgi:hypothetical protein